MAVTNEQRFTIYNSFPEEIQKLYSSTQTTALQSALIDTYQIEDVSNYIDIVGDTILGVHPFEQLKELIVACNISEANATQINIQLQKYLEPVKEYWEIQRARGSSDTQTNSTVTETSAITALHTMASDADRIHHGYGAFRTENPTEDQINEPVHTSSQDSVLQKPTLAEAPHLQSN